MFLHLLLSPAAVPETGEMLVSVDPVRTDLKEDPLLMILDLSLMV